MSTTTSTHNNGAGYRLIVIGASAGGFDAIKKLVAGLPADFHAPVFIVWHMAPTVTGIMPQVLNKVNSIYAAHAYDGESIRPNRIYVAPPDYHLLVEKGVLRVRHGPKENRFRPAVDPLFRSAATAYGARVVGVILSGALDDGTAGLWAIKHNGGIAVVQDPLDAEMPDMPESAMREVDVDYAVPIANMASLLVTLAEKPLSQNELTTMKEDKKAKTEIRLAAEEPPDVSEIMKLGELTPYTCPECHGVLLRLKEANYVRFRCHTGHAFSADSLLLSLSENIEENLYNAIRGIEESIMLLNHIGDHAAENNQPRIAAMYFKKAKEAEYRISLVRQALAFGEPLVPAIEHAEKDTPGTSTG